MDATSLGYMAALQKFIYDPAFDKLARFERKDKKTNYNSLFEASVWERRGNLSYFLSKGKWAWWLFDYTRDD